MCVHIYIYTYDIYQLYHTWRDGNQIIPPPIVGPNQKQTQTHRQDNRPTPTHIHTNQTTESTHRQDGPAGDAQGGADPARDGAAPGLRLRVRLHPGAFCPSLLLLLPLLLLNPMGRVTPSPESTRRRPTPKRPPTLLIPHETLQVDPRDGIRTITVMDCSGLSLMQASSVDNLSLIKAVCEVYIDKYIDVHPYKYIPTPLNHHGPSKYIYFPHITPTTHIINRSTPPTTPSPPQNTHTNY